MKNYSELIRQYKLEILIVECPYNTFTIGDETKNLLGDIFKLKLEGYCSKYPYGIMPVSEYDFMATHVCLVIREGDKVIPVSAFKSISADVCKSFRVPFPVINHMFGMYKDDFKAHVDALQKWQDVLEHKQEKYAYNASWTMKTNMSKELRELVRDISTTLFYWYYTTAGIKHVINSTSANFNVNKLQETMGLKYLHNGAGESLPTFCSPVFFEEPFYFMFADDTGYSEIYTQKCKEFQSLWNERRILNEESIKKKVA